MTLRLASWRRRQKRIRRTKAGYCSCVKVAPNIKGTEYSVPVASVQALEPHHPTMITLCCHRPFLLLLTVVSVHQDMLEKNYMASTPLKKFFLTLMSTVQLSGANIYDTQIVMNTGIRTSDVSLSSELKKHLSTAAHKHGVIDQ